MRDFIRGLFSVRGMPETDAHQRAELILKAAVVLFVYRAVAMATVPFHADIAVTWILVLPGGVIASLLVMLLAKLGRGNSAAVLMAVSLFLTQVAVALKEGPGGSHVSSVVACAVLVACLLRTRVTVIHGVAIFLTIAALAFAQWAGIYQPYEQLVEASWIPFVRQVLTTGIIVTVIRQAYDRLRGEVVERQNAVAVAYEAARAVNLSVEQRVQERTMALSATHDRLNALARQLADELMADLSAVDQRLRAFLVAEAALGPERLTDVVIAAEAAHRLTTMIERLHEHAALGTAALRPAPIDMDALVREIVAEYARAAKGNEGAIEWQLDGLPHAWADPTLIRTVVENLIANAIKFSRSRAPRRIHVGFETGGGRYFVRDNGVGFDAALATKLFRPFQRLHRADEYDGHGVGLANVRRIVERSGGDVCAEGERDRGAVIFFRLPLEATGAA